MENIKSLVPNDKTGFISIYNGSNCVVIFNLQYDFGGTRYLYQSPRFSLYFTQSVSFPKGAENIQLKAWYSLDIKTWKLLYNEEFPSTPENCYKIYEGDCYPICAEIPCNELSSCNHVEDNYTLENIPSSSPSILDPCYCSPTSFCCQPDVLSCKETCYDDKYVCSDEENDVYVCPQHNCKGRSNSIRNPFRLFR